MAGKTKYGRAAISEIKREAGVIGGRVSAAAKKVARAIGLTDKSASKPGVKRTAGKRRVVKLAVAKRALTKRAAAKRPATKRAGAKRGAAKRKVQQLLGATAIAATRRTAKKRLAARGTSIAKTNKKMGLRSSRRVAGRKPRNKIAATVRARKSR